MPLSKGVCTSGDLLDEWMTLRESRGRGWRYVTAQNIDGFGTDHFLKNVPRPNSFPLSPNDLLVDQTGDPRLTGPATKDKSGPSNLSVIYRSPSELFMPGDRHVPHRPGSESDSWAILLLADWRHFCPG